MAYTRLPKARLTLPRLGLSRDACTMELFDCVMKLCEGRIHGRLQSAQWKRPAHRNNDPREPLFVDLFKTLKTLRGLSSSSSANSDDLLQELKSLSETYQAIDNGVGDPIETTLKVRNAVRKSYDICTKDGTCSLEETIRSYGFNASLICQSKAMRQVNKIGRYWGLCVDMPEDSRRYRVLFENVILQCPLPYRTVPTSISYKTSRKQLLDCHVHAEIQLVISYDKEDPRETLKPRAIGVSKAACYLCNLFIRTHGHFFITKTHGQLYDQWTIPDLSTYTSQQRDHYRQILKSMDAKIQADIPRQPKRKRQGHAGSWLSLSTTLKKSTLPSDAGTILSDRSIGTFEPLLSGPVTPGASPPPAPSAQSPGLPTPPASLVQSLYPLQKTLTPSESSVSAIPAVLSTRLTPKSSTPALEPVAHLPSPTDSVHSMPYQPQIKEIPRTNKPNDLTTPPSPPSSISTISLHPLNIPVTRTITAHQFAQFSYAGLHVTIEVEGPCKVEATATQNPNGNAAAPIDVDQMRPGEAIELAGDEGASGMMLLLRHTEVNPPSEPNSMALGLDLRWLS